MKSHFLLLAGTALLAACHVSVSDGEERANSQAPAERKGAAPAQEQLAFEDVAGAPADQPRPVMQAQVVLDRLGFSPGVIDGKEGQSWELALRGFQQANELPETGKLDEATKKALQQWRDVPATRMVRIPADFAKGPFFPNLPKDLNDQAKLPAIGYRDLMEALAERFHTTPETLVALNSAQVKVGANQVIRVPNIADIDAAQLGTDERGWNRTLQMLAVAPKQPQVDKVTVDKSDGVLRAFAGDKLVAQFPVTTGSARDPLPIGTWKIQGVSRNPDFHYNPDLFWDADDSDEKAKLKPGPNGPVGVVWIDISKPHYGIHGTPEPRTIGRTESHGCIRLTNWDAARLAQMVKGGIPAVFEE